MWNKDFSQVSPPGLVIDLKRMNELEVALLTCLKYDVKVRASEYAKYYFLMRSMVLKSGLVDGDDHVMGVSPLDMEGARKLEYVTSNCSLAKPNKISQRSKSEGMTNLSDENKGDRKMGTTTMAKQVNLEQVVNM